MSMSSPLLSVVIPTFNRPQYLSRAIDSALCAAPEGNVEVIVVPNGDDRQWALVAEGYIKDPRVCFSPIHTPHANAARNHGLILAKGKYIRFLDDDDYLFLESASRQLEFMVAGSADFCSGFVQNVDSELKPLGRTCFPMTNDFVCAVLAPSGFRMPTGNLFLRSCLSDARWDESVPRQQDYVWMIHLATIKEWTWLHYPDDVGAWVHHNGPRLSVVSSEQTLPVWLTPNLLNLYRTLSVERRLDNQRRRALAEALLSISHTYFPRFPLYCHRVAKFGIGIDRKAKPPVRFLRESPIGARISPLLFEWLVWPKRYANHLVRWLREKFLGKAPVRKL